jgi:hypothetical protein
MSCTVCPVSFPWPGHPARRAAVKKIDPVSRHLSLRLGMNQVQKGNRAFVTRSENIAARWLNKP